MQHLEDVPVRPQGMSRRDWIVRLMTSSLTMRVLATGVPFALTRHWQQGQALANQLNALCPSNPQFLLLSCSEAGEPINCNAPGTYGIAGIDHSSHPEMAPVRFEHGGQEVTAALPWRSLSDQTLNRLCFFHHASLTNNHAHQANVNRLMDTLQDKDMLISSYARLLAPCLQTIQAEPIALGVNTGGELLSAEGKVLSDIKPTYLKSILLPQEGVLKNLSQLRDKHLDEVYRLVKAQALPGQMAILDQYATSQAQVKSIATDLLESLSLIQDNSPASQFQAATILFQMKLTPACSMRLPFGGDNHFDLVGGELLHLERIETQASLRLLESWQQDLIAKGLQDKITFANLNVFGRTLRVMGEGRDHGNTHTMLILGARVRPSVIGGFVSQGSDFVASPIDEQTGMANSAGQITLKETLMAAGKTLGACLGLPDSTLDQVLPLARVVRAAVQPI